MRCAFERLPSHIIELINFCTRSLPNTESAGTSRRTMNPLRGIRSLSYFTSVRLWAAWRRTSSALACGFQRPRRRVSRESRGNAHREGPSRGRHARSRWSAPAGYGRFPECTWSLRCCWSGARGRLCGERSWVSSASAYKHVCKHHAFPDSPAAPGTSFWSGSDRVRNEPVVQTSARLSLNRAKIKFTFHIAEFRDVACQWSSHKERAQSRSRTADKKPALLPASRTFHLVGAERVTRLCGAGAPFRPLFTPRSVVLCSGEEDLPFHQQGKTSLTKL